MDCCGEYRVHTHAHAHYASPGWEYAGYSSPYAPYAHYYPPPAAAPVSHDPYRYYRYDYPHHMHHNDHIMQMEYGSYASKEARVRRTLARRDARAHTPQHLSHPHTPPSECINNRGPSYCDPQMWSHYQMGMNGNGWVGNGDMNGVWGRGATRDHMRYQPDCRPIKVPSHMPNQNQLCADGRTTPYPVYSDEGPYRAARHRTTPEYPATTPVEGRHRDRFFPEHRVTPPEPKRPPVVPLPAFQQAFGSTEIGKFAEAFSRAEVVHEENDSFSFECPEWEPPPEPQWSSPPAREIKCEDNN